MPRTVSPLRASGLPGLQRQRRPTLLPALSSNELSQRTLFTHSTLREAGLILTKVETRAEVTEIPPVQNAWPASAAIDHRFQPRHRTVTLEKTDNLETVDRRTGGEIGFVPFDGGEVHVRFGDQPGQRIVRRSG